ncbi:MAG TPA: DNA-3-methyladenine glycosylase [Limnochordia bacterium]|nr:DNA-3-methyladenine glycosylase [Limnochordia bacterium]
MTTAELFSLDVMAMARALLDFELVHAAAEGTTAGRIVEVEAYQGPHDRAAHSYGGRPTARTQAMFGPPGRAYIYRIYGMHQCCNVVAAPTGTPHAILLRALAPTEGLPLMAARRKLELPQAFDPARPPRAVKLLTAGPARLVQAMGVDMRYYGHALDTPPYFLRFRGARTPKSDVACGPRINVDYAGEDAARPWRLWLRGTPYLSVPGVESQD